MTTSMLRRAALPLLLAAALPAAAAGPVKLDLGLHGGVVSVTDGKSREFLGGAQLRVHLIWLLAAEARISAYSDTYDLGALGSVDVKNTPVQLSGMLYLVKVPRVGFYLLGGGTYNSVKLDGNGHLTGSVDEKKWCAHVGAGLDVKLWKSVWLNGDARYVYLDVKNASGLLSAAASGYKGDYWTGTVGLNFRLF